MNTTLLLLMLFPLAWPIIAKRIWSREINWTEMFLSMFGVVFLISLLYMSGTYSKMADTEIWNGKVTNKERIHDTYLESYQCNCTSDSKGNRYCSTCYRRHYTVNWNGYTTVGNVKFDSEDSLSSSVYAYPDPESYKRCVVGEPASIEHNFDNYVKAIPESIFNTKTDLNAFASMIPEYPRTYDFYHVNHVVTAGANKVPGNVIQELNKKLNESLRELGPMKEVNIIVVLANTPDSSYRYALENSWIGGKKNDVVLIFGVDQYPKVSWVDVMTFAKNIGNEEFRVSLKDDLSMMTEFDINTINTLTYKGILKEYKRPHMKDFEYLKTAIEPPTWIMVLCIFLSIGGSLLTSFAFYKYEVEDFIGEMVSELMSKITQRS